MNLEEIIRSGESETVEFKESFNDAVIVALSAFANASGGTVFVGIADDGTVKGREDYQFLPRLQSAPSKI